MFGQNLKLSPENTDGSVLKITSIFSTFQGEGPYVGYPSVFIRTSGCNLACSFCDTEFDTYEKLTVEEIISRVIAETKCTKPLIVITGGEPMRQNISPLCTRLVGVGYKIQIESNGTLLCKDLPQEVEIVCSPKISNGKYHMIRDDVLKKTIAIKFIVSASEKYVGKYSNIAEVGQKQYNIPIYIQPMDEYNEELNRANLELAMSLSFHHNAVLSIQMHKTIGID